MSTFGVVDTTIQLTKTHKEVGVVFVDDHIHMDHKTQEYNKNKIMQTFRNNVINSETNTTKIIFNLVRLKTKFVQNLQNEAILQKFPDPQTLNN